MTTPSSRRSQTNRSWLTSIQSRRHASPPQETAKPTPVDLPRELLDKVFSQLNARDLVRCSAVNKHWQASVADDRYWRPFASALRLPNLPSKSCQAAVSAFYAADAREQPQQKHVYSKPPVTILTQDAAFDHQRRMPYFILLSPDARTLATGHSGALVRLKEADTGTTTAVIKIDSRYAFFSPDSQTLAVREGMRAINLVDVATGAVRTIADGTIMAFSPDGNLFATGHINGDLQVRDAFTASIKAARQHNSEVESIIFSPNSRMLATQYVDRTVQVFSADMATVKGTLRQKVFGTGLDFSPDSSTLAAIDNGGNLQLMATDTGVTRARIESVYRYVFSPDSQTLASIQGSGATHLIDPTTGWSRAKIVRTNFDAGHSSSLAFSPDGATLAIGHERKGIYGSHEEAERARAYLRLVDVKTLTVQTNSMHQGNLRAMDFSSDSRMLATGCSYGVMRVIDVKTGRAQAVADLKSSTIEAISANDGSRFAVMSQNGIVRLVEFPAVKHYNEIRGSAACHRGAAQAASTQARKNGSWLKNLLCFRPDFSASA